MKILSGVIFRYMTDNIKYTIGNPTLCGAVVMPDGINFSIDISNKNNQDELFLILYKKDTTQEITRIKIDEKYIFGRIAAVKIFTKNEYDYNYVAGDIFLPDACAKIVKGRNSFGETGDEFITYGIVKNSFKSKNNGFIPYDEAVIYKLHVRGFTAHRSSKVKHKGSFLGVIEKLPYLKELGINIIELMPAYEFNEIMNINGSTKVNFWGYTGPYYFAPKAAYFSNKNYPQNNVCDEFMQMVDTIHKNNMEVIMDFYFSKGTSIYYISECLRYWVLQYGVDGFNVNCDLVDINAIASDPVLSSIKIISGTGIREEGRYIESGEKQERRFAICNDAFLTAARKFLKGDEDTVYEMTEKLKNNYSSQGIVNYLSTNGTFTVMDMVSYDFKHNEDNGENNRDGAEYNYSWNCGAEGITRRKKVLELRLKQIKNAFIFLFTAQGVPLIYSGDELGHSCNGNNNPYCQDNDINYINYNKIRTNSEIYEFVKKLLKFRKEHKVLHQKENLKFMDYNACGCPDASFHGTSAWKLDTNHVLRNFAMMLCGKYEKKDDGTYEDNIYIVYNMYWEPQKFGVPVIGKQFKWKLAFATDDRLTDDSIFKEGNRIIEVPPRTVVILTEDNNGTIV